MATRQSMWDTLPEDVDLIIVGGGINGCGIARDAALRGLKVALFEMRDLAFGTSSRSSKLVHGGLRYLENLEFSLVFEAVSERRILLDIAPHLVNPLGFLFPVYSESPRGLWMINAGMWLYDGLSLFRSPKLHRTLKTSEVAIEEPTLRNDGLKGAPLYYDCATDDARLTLENGVDAAIHGAHICTWARVVDFVKEGGRVVGVEVEDAFTNTKKTIRAPAIINATGPWTDSVVGMSEPLDSPLLRPTKGVHIVVDSKRLPVQHAVVAMHPEDGRVLFAIPWGEQTYVGTTDTDFTGDPAEVHATASDVAYLLEAANHYFPGVDLVSEDVIATWAGLRPLMRPVSQGGNVDASEVSREHQIVIGADGLITIAGGKLTTYRRMSAEVLDTAIKMLRLQRAMPDHIKGVSTDRKPLPGAAGWPEDDDHEAVAVTVEQRGQGKLSRNQARHLANTYGVVANKLADRVVAWPEGAEPLISGRPETLVQVDWAVQEEMAACLQDVFVRRTQIFYRDQDQGLSAVDVVAQRMANLLGWDEERKAKEIADYKTIVMQSRAWRQEQAS